MTTLHPVMAQALAPFLPAKRGMSLTLSLTASDLSAITRVLDCKKSLLLEGSTAYMDRAHEAACVYALYQLIYGNAETTGMNAMLADVARIEADENGEFAAQREQLAISRDTHLDLDKPGKAHLAQTLNAVRLERQFAQTEVA